MIKDVVKITAGTISEINPKAETTSGETFDPVNAIKEIDLLKKEIGNLKINAKNISDSIALSEKNQQKTLNFMMWFAGAIVVGFFLASIPLFFDYYKDSAGKYENYTRRIDKLDARVETLENKK